MNMPLSFQQAIELSQKYQYLIGRLLDPGRIGKGHIECVAIAPFEESRQWLFAQYYLDTRNAAHSLRFYNGDKYDVLLLSVPILRKRSVYYCGLRSYIAQHEIAEK